MHPRTAERGKDVPAQQYLIFTSFNSRRPNSAVITLLAQEVIPLTEMAIDPANLDNSQPYGI